MQETIGRVVARRCGENVHLGALATNVTYGEQGCLITVRGAGDSINTDEWDWAVRQWRRIYTGAVRTFRGRDCDIQRDWDANIGNYVVVWYGDDPRGLLQEEVRCRIWVGRWGNPVGALVWCPQKRFISEAALKRHLISNEKKEILDRSNRYRSLVELHGYSNVSAIITDRNRTPRIPPRYLNVFAILTGRNRSPRIPPRYLTDRDRPPRIPPRGYPMREGKEIVRIRTKNSGPQICLPEKDMEFLVWFFTKEQFACPYCVKKFWSQSDLDAHKLICTERPKDFVCSYCAARFWTQSELDSHISGCPNRPVVDERDERDEEDKDERDEEDKLPVTLKHVGLAAGAGIVLFMMYSMMKKQKQEK